MSRWTTFAAVVTLSAAGIAAVWAAPGPRRPGFRGHAGLLQDARLLDLSDDQQAAVKDLLRQHMEAVRPLMEKQRELHRQLDEAASAPGADPAKVGQIAIDAHLLRDQMRSQREQLEAAFSGLLTPEQKDMWTKIQASRQKERERHRDGRGFGRGPGGPETGPDDIEG
jgi:Spy/CpxP family protein refolding chaperone